MAAYETEKILSVHHWNESLFSFTTSRSSSLRFENGHFVMIGLEVNGRPLTRAYSIVSPNYSEQLEFLSIKVPDGPLTSRLQHIKVGDSILVSKKPVGTLIIHDLKPAKRLFLFGTGTGLAPFMSIIRDPETYERFEDIILVHGVRFVSELAYRDFLENEWPQDEHFGELVQAQFHYYPTVTREPFRTQGRITTQIKNNQITEALNFPDLNPETDRAMICGSPAMLKDISQLLDDRGFKISEGIGQPGDYVIERAFVEK